MKTFYTSHTEWHPETAIWVCTGCHATQKSTGQIGEGRKFSVTHKDCIKLLSSVELQFLKSNRLKAAQLIV